MAENLEFNTNIKVNADTSEAKNDIDALNESIKESSDTTIKVNVDASEAKESVDSINESLNKVVGKVKDSRVNDILKGMSSNTAAEDNGGDAIDVITPTSQNIQQSVGKSLNLTERTKEIQDFVENFKSSSDEIYKEMTNLANSIDDLPDIFEETGKSLKDLTEEDLEDYYGDDAEAINSVIEKSVKFNELLQKQFTSASNLNSMFSSLYDAYEDYRRAVELSAQASKDYDDAQAAYEKEKSDNAEAVKKAKEDAVSYAEALKKIQPALSNIVDSLSDNESAIRGNIGKDIDEDTEKVINGYLESVREYNKIKSSTAVLAGKVEEAEKKEKEAKEELSKADKKYESVKVKSLKNVQSVAEKQVKKEQQNALKQSISNRRIQEDIARTERIRKINAQATEAESKASKYHAQALESESKASKMVADNTDKQTSSLNDLSDKLLGNISFGNIISDAFREAINSVKNLSKEVWNLGLSFEKSSQKMRTLVDESAVSFDSLQKQILGLSSTYGKSIDDVNEAAYQALSASVKTEDLLTILDVAQKASIAGFTDSTTVIDGLTSVINAYGMSVEEADDLANKFLITQNLGKTIFGEIAANIGQIAPNAKIVGLSIEDVLAAIATLTAQGVTTDEAITQINGAINSIIDPTNEAKEAAAQLGVEFNGEALRSKGLIKFLRDIKDAAGDDNDALTDMFGNIRGFKALAGLTEGEDKFNEALYQMQNNTTALDDAFAKMTDTVAFSTDRLKESIKGIGALTFEGLKDPIKDFVDYLDENAESTFDALSLNGLDEDIYESIANLLDALKDSFNILNKSIGPELLELLINILDIITLCIEAINPILYIIEPILSVLNDVLSTLSKINPELLTVVAIVLSVNSAVVTLKKSFVALQALIAGSKLGATLTSFLSGLKAYTFMLQSGAISFGQAMSIAGKSIMSSLASLGASIAPVLLALAAATAVVIGVKAYITEMEEIREMKLEGPNFAEQANKDIEALKEEKKAFDDLIETAKEKEEAENASINRLQSLWDELDSLTDANGKIIENEERAKQIINLLNENYDMNIEYQGNMIKGYKQLSNSMDSYIENLRKESRIRNNQEAYDKALENYDKLNERKKQLEEEIDLDLKSFEAAYAKFEAGDRDYLDVAGVFATQRNANMQVLQEVEAEQQEYLKTIEEYEDLFKENTEEVVDDTFDYIEVKTEDSKKTIEEYLEDIDKLNSDALDTYKDGLDSELNEYEKMLDKKAEAVEEFYDKQLEQQEAAHKKIISDIEAEYALETGKIDEDEYNRELNKLISERDKIQKKINQYGSMDTLKTSADRKELASLQKELESQNENIAEKQHDHEVSLKKAELKEKADLAKDAENKRWEQEKESINKSKSEAVNAQKEANASDLDDFKKAQSAKEEAFKEAQKQMLEDVKTFSADSLAVLTSDWGTYVDSMTGTFKGTLAELSTAQKDVFLSSSEAMQQAITDVRESLSESVDDLSEYMDKIDTIKELQSLPPERIAAKASALDLTVSEALQLKDVDMKMLTEGMTYTIRSAGSIDNSVNTTNSNNITYNYYYNGAKTTQTTYAGAVR